MTLSTRDLERLRAVIDRGETLPPKSDAASSALVPGGEVSPLEPPEAELDPDAQHQLHDEAPGRSLGGSEDPPEPRDTIYDRLRRAQPVKPHRFDPEPWSSPSPRGDEEAGEEASRTPPEPPPEPTGGPIDYAARAALASARAAPEPPADARPEEERPAVRSGPSTEQLLATRAVAKAAREGTRGPGTLLDRGPGGRSGPYRKLV